MNEGTIGRIVVLPGLLLCRVSFIEFIICLVTDDATFRHRHVQGERSWS